MLFDLPLLPGLSFQDGFVSPDEERALIEEFGRAPLTPFLFHGHEGKRLTHSYGWRYDFQDGSFREAEPIPPWLEPLRRRAASFAGLAAEQLVHALIIRYDPGAGIGWHKDRPVFERVIGVSLGGAAEMAFRRRLGERRFERVKLPLPPRSAYCLSGEARHAWEHGIAAHASLRFSVTFRSLSAHGIRRQSTLASGPNNA